MGGACSTHGEAHKSFVGESEGQGPLRKFRYRWEDNIRLDIWEIGGGIHLTRCRVQWQALVNTVMNSCVP
jgi:hypothetical protein